jgi:hypothetical protein
VRKRDGTWLRHNLECVCGTLVAIGHASEFLAHRNLESCKRCKKVEAALHEASDDVKFPHSTQVAYEDFDLLTLNVMAVSVYTLPERPLLSSI